jgi:hypothetical protein
MSAPIGFLSASGALKRLRDPACRILTDLATVAGVIVPAGSQYFPHVLMGSSHDPYFLFHLSYIGIMH